MSRFCHGDGVWTHRVPSTAVGGPPARALRWVAAGFIVFAVALPSTGAAAEPGWSLVRPVASFDRSALTDPAAAARIRAGGSLAGAAGDGSITGQVEYDVEVPAPGWYELTVQGGGLEVEYLVDPDSKAADRPPVTLYSTSGDSLADDKAGNLWLERGRHVIRLQKYFWTGFPRATAFTLRAGDGTLAKSVRVELPPGEGIFPQRGCPPLAIVASARAATTLTVWTREADGRARVAGSVPIPAAQSPVRLQWPLPCERVGLYTLSFGENGGDFAYRDARWVRYEVVPRRADARATSQDAAVRAPARTLVDQVDFTLTPPSATGGETRVSTSAAGVYRESGDAGFTPYQRVPDAARRLMREPGWFAYRLRGVEPQQPHVLEVDYPDDAERTFVVALRESAPLAYPVSVAVDTGGPFPPSGAPQTLSMVFWPRTRDTTAVFLNAHDGRRAAAARMRLYRLDAPLPPLPLPAPGGREFLNWYEEGGNFPSLFGAPDEVTAGTSAATARWIEAARHFGVTTLMPTAVVYSFALYPSRFNRAFSRPDQDPLRRIVLLAEAAGLRVVPELHPRADELDWPFAATPDPRPNLLASKDGRTTLFAADGRTRSRPPLYNPIHPANQDWYVGMIGELADRYRDSPAFAGVSLRLMQWANPALNNFHSLDWGYDDFTVGSFQKDTGLRVPQGDPSPGGRVTPAIARARYEWLTGPGRAAWIEWRTGRIAALYERIRDRLRRARPDLKLYSTVFAWEGMERGADALREAGIDTPRLAAIPGVVMVNALHTYGRREEDARVWRRSREFLTDPARLALVPGGAEAGPAFLTTASYLEITDVVATPAQLGFPASTRGTWTSAGANPPGRLVLERYARQLALTDAALLGDGGNGWSLGQPVLREFVREFTSIPAERFASRADAVGPVVVRSLARRDGLFLYAVSVVDRPMAVRIRIDGARELRRAAGEARVPMRDGFVELELQPFQLVGLRASAGATVSGVTAEPLPPSREAVRADRSPARP